MKTTMCDTKSILDGINRRLDNAKKLVNSEIQQ